MTCPSCLNDGDFLRVAVHRDPIEGKSYDIMHCRRCDLDFSSPMASSREWYEKVWSSHEYSSEAPGPVGLNEPADPYRYAKLFALGLPFKGKVLDVGCGDGYFLQLAASRGFPGAGIDLNRWQVERARLRGLKEVHALTLDEFMQQQQQGPLPVFGWITLFDVLEHLVEPRRIIHQLGAMLEPGGMLAITVPNRGRFYLDWSDADYPPNHLTRWSPRALRGLLESEGFKLVACRARYYTCEYLFSQLFGFLSPPRLIRTLKERLFPRAQVEKALSKHWGPDMQPDRIGTLLEKTPFDLLLSEDVREGCALKRWLLSRGPRTIASRCLHKFYGGFYFLTLPVTFLLKTYLLLFKPQGGYFILAVARK